MDYLLNFFKLFHLYLLRYLNYQLNLNFFLKNGKQLKLFLCTRKGLLGNFVIYDQFEYCPHYQKFLKGMYILTSLNFSSYITCYLILNLNFKKIFLRETVLANMINTWSVAINQNLMNSVVYLDLSEVFDLIKHLILLTKLKTNKCSLRCLNIFESYLTNRTQCTIFQGKEFDKITGFSWSPERFCFRTSDFHSFL